MLVRLILITLAVSGSAVVMEIGLRMTAAGTAASATVEAQAAIESVPDSQQPHPLPSTPIRAQPPDCPSSAPTSPFRAANEGVSESSGVCAGEFVAVYEREGKWHCQSNPTLKAASLGPPEAMWFLLRDPQRRFLAKPQQALPPSLCTELAEKPAYQPHPGEPQPVAEIIDQDQTLPVRWVCHSQYRGDQ